jgi:hypothetical protein
LFSVSLSLSGVNHLGQTTLNTVQPFGADGSNTRITHQTQLPDGTIEQQTLDFGRNGKVAGFTVQTYPGKLATDPVTGKVTVQAPSSPTAPNFDPNYSPTSQPYTSTSAYQQMVAHNQALADQRILDANGNQLTVEQVNELIRSAGEGAELPENLATESTLSAVLGQLKHGQAEISEPSIAEDQPLPGFGDTFDDLLSWNLPAHSAECPQPTIMAFDNSFVVDTHCTLVNNNWGTLQAAMAVFWLLIAMGIVLRA